MSSKCFYRGYYLSAITTPEDTGGYRARVAIMALDGDKTRSQRFVDFGLFASKDQADEHAIEAGKEWIDVQLKQSTGG
jgi:hypothetical protein